MLFDRSHADFELEAFVDLALLELGQLGVQALDVVFGRHLSANICDVVFGRYLAFDIGDIVGDWRSRARRSRGRCRALPWASCSGSLRPYARSISRRSGGAGKQPSRADKRRAALHAGMGDVLKIVRFGAISVQCGCDGRNRHPVSAMRAGSRAMGAEAAG
jgi:hypothetical protein